MAKVTKRHLLDETLSDAEKSQLEAFCANPMMVQAIKKILLFTIYNNGTLERGENPNPTMNFILSYALQDPKVDDATIGRDVRVQAAAVRLLEIGFMEIEGYEKVEETKSKDNPAR